MSNQCHVFFSNRMEVLFAQLKAALFAHPLKPFMRRHIIVPHRAMKSWLMLQLASDPQHAIAAGVAISCLEEGMEQLNAFFLPEQQLLIAPKIGSTSVSALELALAIEVEMQRIVSGALHMPPEEQIIWQPLFAYLKLPFPDRGGVSLSKKTERRVTALCQKLAELFMLYNRYATEMTSSWKGGAACGWQQHLWCRLFAKRAEEEGVAIDTLEPEACNELAHCNVQVHLFAIDYLPKLFHSFFMRLAAKIPLHYYILSPCQAFWSDIHSDRESQRLQAYWKKRGIAQGQQVALEELLRNRNSLLANLGKLGREMAMQIEESEVEVEEAYLLPLAVASHEEYSDYLTDEALFENVDRPLSLLEAMKADLLLMRNPDGQEPIAIEDAFRSIQVHSATTRMREVQILYDILLGIMHRHADDEVPIYSGDILVMAPNMREYEPFIASVFAANDSQLEAAILEVQLSTQSALIQGFLHLLSLPFGRWDTTALLQLFDYTSFQIAQQFSSDDIHHIREWIKASGVRWGDDLHHRNELLDRSYCMHSMVEESDVGTWEYALERLLSGLVMSIGERELPHGSLLLLPLESIDASQGELLGKWIRLMRSLRQDLRCLHDGSKLHIKEWSRYLRCLVDAYFAIDSTERRAEDHYHALVAALDAFSIAYKKIGEASFSFTTIRHHIEELLQKRLHSYREHALHAVRFSSLSSLRAIPARVVVLLGMQEGVFPTHESSTSLNLMQGNSLADYSPSGSDRDRFLFLEMVLSAQRYFIMTYQGYSPSDRKEQSPSLLLTELFSYLDKSYVLEGKKPSQICMSKHPLYAFDRAYFESHTHFRSYSHSNYLAAKAHYSLQKKAPHRFIPEFALANSKGAAADSEEVRTSEEITVAKQIRITIQELAVMARNPIKAYFNKTLGIYLEGLEERVIKNEEDFQLSTLQYYGLKKAALNQPLEWVLNRAEREGRLPGGAFKAVAIDKIRRDVQVLKNNLEGFGVSPENIFEVELSEHCYHPVRFEEGNWQVPALRLAYAPNVEVIIVGKLPEVVSQGLVAQLRDDKSDVVKSWPQFLVLCCLNERNSLPIDSKLLLVKSSKGKAKEAFSKKPQHLLMQYLTYYFTALETLSPLIPEWIPHFFLADPAELQEKISHSLTDAFQPLYNDYMHWAMRGLEGPDGALLCAGWQGFAQSLFGDLYQNWYPSREKKGSVELDDDQL